MSRSGLGILSLLVSLALVGALWAMNARQNGPTSPSAQRVETQAAQVAAGVNFTQAASQLELYRAQNGTFVGATLPASFGVVVARADAASYCLQSGTGTAMQHENGPGGVPAAGSC